VLETLELSGRILLRRILGNYQRRLLKAWRQVEDADTICEAMEKCIQRSTKKILGTSRRGGNKIKGAWWWNEPIKEKVKEKKEAYTAFMNSRTDEEKESSRVRYKAVKKAAKKVVAVAKSTAYDRLYQKLETKEGEKEVFKLTRARERRPKGFEGCEMHQR